MQRRYKETIFTVGVKRHHAVRFRRKHVARLISQMHSLEKQAVEKLMARAEKISNQISTKNTNMDQEIESLNSLICRWKLIPNITGAKTVLKFWEHFAQLSQNLINRFFRAVQHGDVQKFRRRITKSTAQTTGERSIHRASRAARKAGREKATHFPVARRKVGRSLPVACINYQHAIINFN